MKALGPVCVCSVSFIANINFRGCDRHGAVRAERENERLAWPFLAVGVKCSLGLPEAGRRAELPGRVSLTVIRLTSWPDTPCLLAVRGGTLHTPNARD